MPRDDYLNLVADIEEVMSADPSVQARWMLGYPSAARARWLVRVDRAHMFWQVLLPNGWRGKWKRQLTRAAYPTIAGFMRPTAVRLPDYDFVYTGVADGKRSYVAIKLRDCDGGMIIRKFLSGRGGNQGNYENEVKILRALRDDRSGTFPRMVQTGSNYIEMIGKRPSREFNPSDPRHRSLLVDGLCKFYEKFELKLDADGLYTCMCHGDLNQWNAFISDQDSLHIFDFETARFDFLGRDLLTALAGNISTHEFPTAFSGCFASIASKLGLRGADPHRHLRRLL